MYENTSIQYGDNYHTNNDNINNHINITEIKNSQKGYDSTLAPFFRPFEDNNTDDIECESIIPETDLTNIDIINSFSQLCGDKAIQDFFINNKGIDREIYIKDWTFFSIEKILSLDKIYKESNINNIFDLGFIYHGMGWVVVAFYYIPNKKIYFRMDGGSNGWDRADNFNRLKTIDKLLENNKTDIDFLQLLNKIENNEYSILNDII